MKFKNQISTIKNYIIFFVILFTAVSNIYAQQFVHPGIDMNQKDLDYMKKQV